MSVLHIKNATILRPAIAAALESVLVVDGKIAAFDPAHEQLPNDCESIDAAGQLLTPGLIDIHTHGIHVYPYERDPQDLLKGASRLGQYGTTCILPTLYKVFERNSLTKLEQLAEALPQIGDVEVPGFHLEGPFLAIPGAGSSTIPGDVGLLEEILAAAGGRVRAMSVSPDCPNVIPVIERLREHNITVFITHTRATTGETCAAIDAGARHATHFYDVFPIPDETEPGVRPVGAVEAMLADPRCTVDFICDCVHVDPIAIQMAIAAKGFQGVVAITDSNVGAGNANGVYPTPWGYSVKVSRDDAARVHEPSHLQHGLLAGSSLTMDRAISNLLEWLDLPPHQVWAMGTRNPARVIGMTDKGRMDVGADADLVLWKKQEGRLRAVRTWVGGKCVFASDDSAPLETVKHGEHISI